MRQALTFVATLFTFLLASWVTLAQAPPPPAAPAPVPAEPAVPPAAWYEGYGWWWIVLAVIIIAALVWYFAKARSGPRY